MGIKCSKCGSSNIYMRINNVKRCREIICSDCDKLGEILHEAFEDYFGEN